MAAARGERLEVQLIALDNIRVDHDLQSRAAMHKDYEREFMQAMLRGDAFPPVVVFWDGKTYWLADGFHRHGAARNAGFKDIRAEIHYGSRRDALIHSAGSNKAFSIPRSDADKKKAAYMLFSDREWFEKSGDLIAAHVGVKGGTINSWRKDFCREHGKRPPVVVVTARGTKQSATPHSPGSVWRDRNKVYWARIGGKDVELASRSAGPARHEADRRIEEYRALRVAEKIRAVRGQLGEDDRQELSIADRIAIDDEVATLPEESGKARPGWDGDKLFDHLRGLGVKVTRPQRERIRHWSWCHLILESPDDRAIVVCWRYGNLWGRHEPGYAITPDELVGRLILLRAAHEEGDRRERLPARRYRLIAAAEGLIALGGSPDYFHRMLDPSFEPRIHFCGAFELAEKFGPDAGPVDWAALGYPHPDDEDEAEED